MTDHENAYITANVDALRAAVRAEWERQGGTSLTALTVPKSWVQRGRRVRKEVSAALGYEPGMKETLDYLAAKAGER